MSVQVEIPHKKNIKQKMFSLHGSQFFAAMMLPLKWLQFKENYLGWRKKEIY